jgi:hypothetical protein
MLLEKEEKRRKTRPIPLDTLITSILITRSQQAETGRSEPEARKLVAGGEAKRNHRYQQAEAGRSEPEARKLVAGGEAKRNHRSQQGEAGRSGRSARIWKSALQLAVFSAEDQVIAQRSMGRGHATNLSRSCQGAIHCFW